AVLPGSQAGFVNSGAERGAFRHASDLMEWEEEEEENGGDGGKGGGEGEGDEEGEGNGAEGERGGNGGGRRGRAGGRRRLPSVADELKRGELKIVQVTKEPIGTKGPRVTAQVSLAGRFLVYMPFASKVGVSRKIGK